MCAQLEAARSGYYAWRGRVVTEPNTRGADSCFTGTCISVNCCDDHWNPPKHRKVYSIILRDIAATEAVANADSIMEELQPLLLAGRTDALSQVGVSVFLAGLVAPAIDQRIGRLSAEETEIAIVEAGLELTGPPFLRGDSKTK